MGDLRVAFDDLAEDVLAQVLAFIKIGQQTGFHFIEAFNKQRMAFFRDLLGVTDGNQDAAQHIEQGEIVVEVISGHGGVL